MPTANMFNTEEEKQEAIVHLQELMKQPGWQLLVGMMDSDLNNLRTELEDGENTDNKDGERKLRIKLMKELKELPTKKIRELSPSEAPESDDPYPTVADLK